MLEMSRSKETFSALLAVWSPVLTELVFLARRAGLANLAGFPSLATGLPTGKVLKQK